MDYKKVTPLLLVLITGLLIYSVFFGQSSVKETKKLARELKQQVDTLSMLNEKYDRLQQKYLLLYNDLRNTRADIYSFKKKVEAVSKQQTSNVKNIKAELNRIIEQYDSLEQIHHDSLSFVAIDSLKF
ncbi:hypothetical protein E1176_18260 [Fulvivirga sp. RKSG066]|uniref:hypothetical protein n=1 Tax=Fulvivirga aurantia TaxID=2529383 RepID=UPI0012BBD4A0|nr:hypothetical protein [Fulvivirga aurantia]MTI22980.1 hypothetical protein [Fulvivirga aurantia]